MIRTMNKAIVPYNMCPTLITNTVFTPGFGFYIINDDCNLNFPEATSIGNDKYNYWFLVTGNSAVTIKDGPTSSTTINISKQNQNYIIIVTSMIVLGTNVLTMFNSCCNV